MGKKVIEKHEHGEFIRESVDEIPPLGEDRKTIFVPEMPVEKLMSQLEGSFSQASAGLISILVGVMGALEEKYGDEVWDVASKWVYDSSYQRAKGMGQLMKVDPEDARSVGRIWDLEACMMGIKSEWIETGKKRAVLRFFQCPLASAVAECPKVCDKLLFEAVERGNCDALGVRVKSLYMPKMIPKGDAYCEIVLELED
jgi:hypothetical protein